MKNSTSPPSSYISSSPLNIIASTRHMGPVFYPIEFFFLLISAYTLATREASERNPAVISVYIFPPEVSFGGFFNISSSPNGRRMADVMEISGDQGDAQVTRLFYPLDTRIRNFASSTHRNQISFTIALGDTSRFENSTILECQNNSAIATRT